MRILIRHAVALLLVGFVCKVVLQAQAYRDFNGVPKSLLLGSLAPEAPIPSSEIDARQIINAIRNQ